MRERESEEQDCCLLVSLTGGLNECRRKQPFGSNKVVDLNLKTHQTFDHFQRKEQVSSCLCLFMG